MKRIVIFREGLAPWEKVGNAEKVLYLSHSPDHIYSEQTANSLLTLFALFAVIPLSVRSGNWQSANSLFLYQNLAWYRV